MEPSDVRKIPTGPGSVIVNVDPAAGNGLDASKSSATTIRRSTIDAPDSRADPPEKKSPIIAGVRWTRSSHRTAALNSSTSESQITSPSARGASSQDD